MTHHSRDHLGRLSRLAETVSKRQVKQSIQRSIFMQLITFNDVTSPGDASGNLYLGIVQDHKVVSSISDQSISPPVKGAHNSIASSADMFLRYVHALTTCAALPWQFAGHTRVVTLTSRIRNARPYR